MAYLTHAINSIVVSRAGIQRADLEFSRQRCRLERYSRWRIKPVCSSTSLSSVEE